MLTGKQVRVRFARNYVIAQYLDPRDPQWLDVAEQLLRVFRASVGSSRGAVTAEIDELFGNLPQPLIHNGLAKLLEDRCEFATQAGLPPEEVRSALFLAAARERRAALEEVGHAVSRENIVQDAAKNLQTTDTEIEASLFADLKSEQRLVQFKDITAERLLERYNVALAQAILLRSSGVEIVLRGETPQRCRQLFRQIKFHRLICDIELASESAPFAHASGSGGIAYCLRVDGPLSLFSATQKYGLQLALFLPALLLCKNFELTAKLRWGAERKEKVFQLSAADGLTSHLAETGAYLPPEAVMFVDLFRKKIADWEISDQAEIIPLGKNVWVPDYRLVHRASGNVVLLDILGFWRRSSAERHLEMLRQHAGAPFIVAVSDQLGVDDEELADMPEQIVRFRNMPLPDEVARRAAALIGAADK